MPVRLISIVLTAVLFMTSAELAARKDFDHSHPASFKDNDTVLSIISDRVASYNNTYPEIHFIHLAGSSNEYLDFVRVLRLLGTEPQPLDYEHSADLREDLLDVTMHRLKLMLHTSNVSATLFRVSEDSVLERKNLCLITLNPDDFATSGQVAVENLLNLPAETISKIHTARKLDNIDYLQFVLNHEMFHCVDTYLHGGQRMVGDNFSAEYDLVRRESVADAFAMAVHIKNHKGITSFARNFLHMRALWIYSNSPHHCTYETVIAVLNHEQELVKSKDYSMLAEFANRITNETAGNYSNFVSNHAAELGAAKSMGINIEKYGEGWTLLADYQKDKKLENYFANQFEYYYRMLFNDEQITF